MMEFIYEDEPMAVAIFEAIHTGDIPMLKKLLAENPDLVTVRIIARDYVDNSSTHGMSRTLLHVVTDWPGHFPNGGLTVNALVEAGAEVNARFTGPHTETPLHWAASSNDLEVLNALIDAGADIEAPGAVIGGGTPLDDAVAFRQWNAAHCLVRRGAKTNLWHCAALGLMDQLKEYFNSSIVPAHNEITSAFWMACHGGQLVSAKFLWNHGADSNWIGYDERTPLDAARCSNAKDLVDWLLSLRSNPSVEQWKKDL